jgi:CheY-like chemotaxis protein
MLFKARKERHRVLIVEDDWAILEVLKLILEDDGYIVVTAEHGGQAIAAIASKAFDLVLMDVAMPGMSGIDVALKLRAEAKTHDVLIAIHTGLDEHWVRERFVDYDLFLTKAADTDVLVDEIRKLFEQPRSPREQRAVELVDERYTMTEAIRAQQALREGMALGPELLSIDALIGMLGDEIDQLRRLGETDAQIARRIEEALGRPLPASSPLR